MKAGDKSARVRCADCKWLGREYTCWVCTNPSCTAQSIVFLQRMNRRMVLAPRVCFSFSVEKTQIIMDYKKEYEEMVQRARELHEGGDALTKLQMEIVCPELEGSEDERIRKEIRNFLIDMECKEEWIAYLEKQKEQKPIKVLYIPKFREGDMVVSKNNPRLTYQILDVGNINELGNPEYKVEIFTDGKSDEPRNIKYIEVAKMDSWGELVEQKPAEWSEEDEIIQGHIIDVLTYYAENHSALTVAFIKRDIDWLKSLPMGCPKKTE